MIKVTNVTKAFSENVILNEIDLTIEKGTWTSIVGPSGSGKSTLLNCISGLLKPNTGEVLYEEADLYKMSEKKRSDFRRQHIGFVFQDFKLLPYYSVLDNVMLPLFYDTDRKKLRERAGDSLERLGIEVSLHHRLPAGLSGGEKQRVAMARSLIADPDVLICDEPSGNLDEANRDNIIDLLKRLKDQDKTIVLVTHDPVVAACGDAVYHLKRGSLEKEGIYQ